MPVKNAPNGAKEYKSGKNADLRYDDNKIKRGNATNDGGTLVGAFKSVMKDKNTSLGKKAMIAVASPVLAPMAILGRTMERDAGRQGLSSAKRRVQENERSALTAQALEAKIAKTAAETLEWQKKRDSEPRDPKKFSSDMKAKK